MFSPQHGKRITIESYYEGNLASSKQEIEVSLLSSREAILKDIIEALGVISSGETHKLNMEIIVDKEGRYRLVKRWTV